MEERDRTGQWTGEDLKDLIWLMTFTGYRISDAVFFDTKRMKGNQIFIRATKNGGDVFAYIPDWLRDRLLARAERLGGTRSSTMRTARSRTSGANRVGRPIEPLSSPHIGSPGFPAWTGSPGGSAFPANCVRCPSDRHWPERIPHTHAETIETSRLSAYRPGENRCDPRW